MNENIFLPTAKKGTTSYKSHPITQKKDISPLYIVNPAYKFKGDHNNVIITNNNPARYDANRYRENITQGFAWRIPPDLAVLFSFFDGTLSLDVAAEQFCLRHGSTRERFYDTVKPCICNEKLVAIPANDGHWVTIPKNFLIPNTDGLERKNMLESMDIPFILKNYNLSEVRLNVPNSMILMLNTSCVAECVYCYADRPAIRNPVPFPRLTKLLEEAWRLGMPYVDVDGGEFFLYPYWRELVSEMRRYDYSPLISTKHPLSEKMVSELKHLGISDIQLSIDSVKNDEMQQMLNVDDGYIERVLHGLRLLDEAGIEVTVKPVITRYNDSEQSLNDTIEVLTSFGNVTHINFTPAEFSRFKASGRYFSTGERLARLKTIVEDRNRDCEAVLSFLDYAEPQTVMQRVEEFPNRLMCTGNVQGFFVLPDGKVTYCERMYWHPFFIIGDLTSQSIMEMWNSKKALKRWNFSQREVRGESPCKTCDEFERCRRGLGNCWRLAVDAYGDDNYDYPAPNCPKALPPNKDFYIP